MVYLLVCVVFNFFDHFLVAFRTSLLALWLDLFLDVYTFWCNCTWDCFLNFSFWWFIFHVYKRNKFLYINLYHDILLNSLISSSSFFVTSLGFSIHTITSSANSDSFNSSFSIWILFISNKLNFNIPICLVRNLRFKTLNYWLKIAPLLSSRTKLPTQVLSSSKIHDLSIDFPCGLPLWLSW